MFAVLIRQPSQGLPIHSPSILFDSTLPDDGTRLERGPGWSFYCEANPTADQLIARVRSVVDAAKERNWPIIIDANVNVPPELLSGATIYVDGGDEQSWRSLATYWLT